VIWVLLLVIYGNSSVEVMTSTHIEPYYTEQECSVAGAKAAKDVQDNTPFYGRYVCVQRRL
jgi:hypothetical protein